MKRGPIIKTHLIIGLPANEHSMDFNFYNYYVSKHIVVKGGKNYS